MGEREEVTVGRERGCDWGERERKECEWGERERGGVSRARERGGVRVGRERERGV